MIGDWLNDITGLDEQTANQITLWAVAITFPVVGVGKLYLSQIMRRNTYLRTALGDWLVKMFIAIGMAFICVGVTYAMVLAVGWLHIPLWARWLIRITGVIAALMSLVGTVMVVRFVVPLLRSPLLFDHPHPSEVEP